MWCKNGEKTLRYVLPRIDKIMSTVNQKIIADDHSIDRTADIVKEYGWDVYSNKGEGLSDNANTALEHVKSDRFCTFEQDVLPSRDWFKITQLVDGDVACAQGVRLSTVKGVRQLQKEYIEKCKVDSTLRYCSVDNNCFNTEIVRQVGGFPKIKGLGGMDVLLHKKIVDLGYKWLVDYSIVSDHIRPGGLWQEVRHSYKYGRATQNLKDIPITPRSKRSFIIEPLSLLSRGSFYAFGVYVLLKFSKGLGAVISRCVSIE